MSQPPMIPPPPPPGMATGPCPHCGAANPYGSTFCSSCGKALPTGMPSGPRVLGGQDFATTAAGQKLQGDELQKTAKKAAGALLAVAIISTIATCLFFVLMNNMRGAAGPGVPVVNPLMIAIMGAVTLVFWGLWFWARVNPLPAAIVGLVLYGTLIAINVVTSVSQMGETGARGGLGIGCIDIIIIGVLIQAIQAGVKHRKLMRQQAGI